LLRVHLHLYIGVSCSSNSYILFFFLSLCASLFVSVFVPFSLLPLLSPSFFRHGYLCLGVSLQVFLKDITAIFHSIFSRCPPVLHILTHLFRPPRAMQQQQQLWLGVLVCGLLSLTCVPGDNVHPERGQMLQRVKRALADLTSENQVGHVVPCTIMQT
jgi:hypothetical protein